MKNITKVSVSKDIQLLRELQNKYYEAIWEGQEGQAAHFDNQLKLTKICMCDIRSGLYLALTALERLNQIDFKED